MRPTDNGKNCVIAILSSSSNISGLIQQDIWLCQDCYDSNTKFILVLCVLLQQKIHGYAYMIMIAFWNSPNIVLGLLQQDIWLCQKLCDSITKFISNLYWLIQQKIHGYAKQDMITFPNSPNIVLGMLQQDTWLCQKWGIEVSNSPSMCQGLIQQKIHGHNKICVIAVVGPSMRCA